MANIKSQKMHPLVQKSIITGILLAGAILLEIRLIYAVVASIILNLVLHQARTYLRVFGRTWPRDLKAIIRLFSLKINFWNFMRRNQTLGDLFVQNVRRHPNKAAFLYEDQRWSYQNVEDYSNQVGNFFNKNAAVSPKDTVAICVTSRPEFICLWLGLSKIGCVAALINYQLRGDSLIHSLQACHAKAIIIGAELLDAAEEIRSRIPSLGIFVIGERGKPSHQVPAYAFCLDRVLPQISVQKPVIQDPKSKGSSNRLFYIFTSGTTGMPKAAIVTHSRFYYMAFGMRSMLNITNDDILYCTLPLYHSSGGILGVGQALLGGTTVVIRKKFSASQFWLDCGKYNCTVAQYIGEMCRYLLVQKETPADRQHKVRLMFGNGLQAQIWVEFQRRFNVGQIGEFYGATEGNASLINMDNKIGAVGFTSRILPPAYPVSLIRVDSETGEPLRDEKGMCIHCRAGEPGELVGKIKLSGIHKFDGYCNGDATKKKIAQDVFKRGDMAFLTGDIVVQDEDGYIFFKDRTGDTFRWRGENVSTSEVETVISQIVGLEAVVVFGVDIPGCEGKAGMACITGDETKHDLVRLNEEMKHGLPSYAQPIFLRFVKEVEQTGTFKIIKNRLKDDAFDPHRIKSDGLFFFDPQAREYRRLTEELYETIRNGLVRF